MYRIVLRTQVTVGRIAFLAALALIGIVVGIAIGVGDVFDRLDAGTNLINSFGLSLYAPVATLVFASALQDRHLAYGAGLQDRGVVLARGPLVEQDDPTLRGLSIWSVDACSGTSTRMWASRYSTSPPACASWVASR